MERALDPQVEQALYDNETTPWYLIKIDSNQGALRFSTAGTISHSGYTWVGGPSLSSQSSGDWTLTIPNADGQAFFLGVNDSAYGSPVTVWALDGGGKTIIYTGFVGEATNMSYESVAFNLYSTSPVFNLLPNVFLKPPFANFSIQPGTEVSFGGQTYILEPEE